MPKINNPVLSRRQLTRRFIQGAMVCGLTSQISLANASTRPLADQTYGTMTHGTMTGHCLPPREKLALGAALLCAKGSSTNDAHLNNFIATTSGDQLQEKIQQDYQTLNLVLINGWTLSKTEAQLYAAAARFN